MGMPCWHIIKERVELGQGILVLCFRILANVSSDYFS
jgi:hypothetical protein